MPEQVEVQDTAETVGTTKVKVRFTTVKYFDSEKNTAITVDLLGKYSSVQCKEYVKAQGEGNLLINKQLTNEVITVDTVALYALKITQ